MSKTSLDAARRSQSQRGRTGRPEVRLRINKWKSARPEDKLPEAFIYDHVRTPRGRGKPDGTLHEVSPTVISTFDRHACTIVGEGGARRPR
jgi:hypothetical protein